MPQLGLEHIPNQTGYLVMDDTGILACGGDLENNRAVGQEIYSMVKMVDGSRLSEEAKPFRRMSLYYEDHYYLVVLSNKKVHIVKRKLAPSDSQMI